MRGPTSAHADASDKSYSFMQIPVQMRTQRMDTRCGSRWEEGDRLQRFIKFPQVARQCLYNLIFNRVYQMEVEQGDRLQQFINCPKATRHFARLSACNPSILQLDFQSRLSIGSRGCEGDRLQQFINCPSGTSVRLLICLQSRLLQLDFNRVCQLEVEGVRATDYNNVSIVLKWHVSSPFYFQSSLLQLDFQSRLSLGSRGGEGDRLQQFINCRKVTRHLACLFACNPSLLQLDLQSCLSIIPEVSHSCL